METTSSEPGGISSELSHDARTVADSAKQRLHSEIDARKGDAANQAKQVSSAISQAGEQLGQNAPSWLRSAFDSAAQTVQRLADTVDRKDSRQLTGDIQRIARENPGSFLAACAVAGFAAARVMQAGASRANSGNNGTGADWSGNRQSFSNTQGGMGAGQAGRSAVGLTSAAEPYAYAGDRP